MEPLQIILIVLALAGIWAVAELAIALRRARTTMGRVDRAVDGLNEAIAETRPVIAKLDGALDDLQPAMSRVEPLLESANVAVDALSANLVEVEAVVRDVSQISGAAASAGSAVSDAAGSASDAVQRLLGRVRGGGKPALDQPDGDPQVPDSDAATADELPEEGARAYFTYGEDETEGNDNE